MIGRRISVGKREKMAICNKCLHKEVCAFRKQTRDSCAESCEDFLGWIKTQDERPALYDDTFMLDRIGYPFVGYYTKFKDEETFKDASTLQKNYRVSILLAERT